jgi:hypothetical protein
MVAAISPAHGQSVFEIDDAQVTTNGGATLDGEDTILVTETGSVVPPAGNNGLESTGDDNSLTNNGDIETTGNDASGIFSFGNNNTLTNNGSVKTTGMDAFGLYARSGNNTVANNGSVVTIGDDAFGLYGRNGDNTVTNSGSVMTSGEGAYGLRGASGNNTVTNSGSVVTEGDNAEGLSANGGDNTFINSGSVITGGVNAHGLSATGDDNTVTNSGKVFATNGLSIRTGGAGNEVTLLEGSILFGDVSFSNADGTFSFGPGLNAVVQLSGSTPDTIVVPNDAYVIDTTGADTVIAIDSTGFVAADQGVAELGSQILGALDRLGPGAAAPEVTQGSASADGSFTWGGAIGGFATGGETDTTAGYVALNGGIIGGHTFGGDTGIFLGLTASRQESDSSFEQNTGTLFAGVQGGWQMGGLDVKASLTAGVSSTDQTRIIANNTVMGPTIGIEEAEASYNTAFVMPAITFSGDMDRGSDSFTPSLRLRYGKIMQDGYSETGSADPTHDLVVEDREAEFLEVRLQIERGLEDKRVGDATMSTAMRIGFDAQVFSGDDADLTVAAHGLSFGVHDEEVVGRIFAGMDMVRLGDSGSQLTAGFEAGFDTTKRMDVSVAVKWVLSF